MIFAATNGFLDRVSVDRVEEFHAELTERMHSEHGDLLKRIAAGEWEDDVEADLREAVADFSDDFGYDLDEEGLPEEEGDEEPAASSAGDEDEDEGETADEPEKEAAPA